MPLSLRHSTANLVPAGPEAAENGSNDGSRADGIKNLPPDDQFCAGKSHGDEVRPSVLSACRLTRNAGVIDAAGWRS